MERRKGRIKWLRRDDLVSGDQHEEATLTSTRAMGDVPRLEPLSFSPRHHSGDEARVERLSPLTRGRIRDEMRIVSVPIVVEELGRKSQASTIPNGTYLSFKTKIFCSACTYIYAN